ncbi:MAG TPA: LUD domain-containing protein [Candidatus Luteococcus avicola]|nr:LUD domain-containing protein [Candidatus Luteococcus avicola]
MDARTEILDRIRRASADITETDPHVDVPVEWTYGTGLPLDDVVATFVEKVLDYQATVVRVAAANVAQAVVDGLVASGVTSSVVVPPGLDPAWLEAMRCVGWEVRVDDPPLTHEQLNGTDAVVTAASSAIADTGTIVLTHGPDQGRRAITLVPDRHVCVVRASQVVSDVPESIAAVKQEVLEGCPMTMISGGSATSDIELSRVDGVHGPRQLYLVVVDDL